MTSLHAPQSVDVVVVGAGLSGLRAATLLHEAGLKVAVPEAMDRVGGKTLSEDASPDPHVRGGKVDLGAAWLNDTNQSEMFKLAQEFGFDLIEQRATGLDLLEQGDGTYISSPYGQQLPTTELDTAIFAALNKDVEERDVEAPWKAPGAAELDAETFHQYAVRNGGSSPEAAAVLADQLAMALLGCQAGELSALCMLDYLCSGTGLANMSADTKHGGQYLRNRQGNQSFSTRLAAKLPPGSIALSTPVTRVVQIEPGRRVLVETATTTGSELYWATKVVLSMPSPLLPLIDFVPPLPAAKTTLARETALGYYAKTVFVFASPWWRTAGLSGAMSADTGPIVFTRDTCSEADGKFSITCFHVGDIGHAWSRWSAAERRRQVKDQFDRAFGEAARGRGVEPEKPVKVLEKKWVREPWDRGAPCSYIMNTGTMTGDAMKAMRAAFGDVHFIGTETALVWKGYMEGTVRSGMRGAAEVIAALQPAKPL